MRSLDIRHDCVLEGLVRFAPSYEVGTGNDLRHDLLAIYFDPDRTAPMVWIRDKFGPRAHRIFFSVALGVELIEVEKTDAAKGADVRVVVFAS